MQAGHLRHEAVCLDAGLSMGTPATAFYFAAYGFAEICNRVKVRYTKQIYMSTKKFNDYFFVLFDMLCMP